MSPRCCTKGGQLNHKEKATAHIPCYKAVARQGINLRGCCRHVLQCAEELHRCIVVTGGHDPCRCRAARQRGSTKYRVVLGRRNVFPCFLVDEQESPLWCWWCDQAEPRGICLSSNRVDKTRGLRLDITTVRSSADEIFGWAVGRRLWCRDESESLPE